MYAALNMAGLLLDAKQSAFSEFFLTSVKPAYVYENGAKTEKVDGYVYTCKLPKKGFEQIGVKIPGDKKITLQDGEYAKVAFTDLVLKIYFRDEIPLISAKATNVRKV